METEEQREQVEQKDFSAEMMAKAMGCSRDHSKEIDIYEKPYEEKVDRIRAMKEKGNEAFQKGNFEESTYYYAQALLIFYYLIPETKE